MPRRQPGSLFPLEVAILATCQRAGEPGIHGFAIARQMLEHGDTRRLAATGTLYRALYRMEEAGLLESSWATPADEETTASPRRRMYRITQNGVTALATAPVVQTRSALQLRQSMEQAT
jgi:DNA-binding PadR family transcriptional regulator